MDRKDKVLNVIKAYKELFSTENGKIVLFDLMDESCFLKPTFSMDGHDATLMNEGKRQLLLCILQKSNIDYGKLQEVLQDKIQEEENYV